MESRRLLSGPEARWPGVGTRAMFLSGWVFEGRGEDDEVVEIDVQSRLLLSEYAPGLVGLATYYFVGFTGIFFLLNHIPTVHGPGLSTVIAVILLFVPSMTVLSHSVLIRPLQVHKKLRCSTNQVKITR